MRYKIPPPSFIKQQHVWMSNPPLTIPSWSNKHTTNRKKNFKILNYALNSCQKIHFFEVSCSVAKASVGAALEWNDESICQRVNICTIHEQQLSGRDRRKKSNQKYLAQWIELRRIDAQQWELFKRQWQTRKTSIDCLHAIIDPYSHPSLSLLFLTLNRAQWTTKVEMKAKVTSQTRREETGTRLHIFFATFEQVPKCGYVNQSRWSCLLWMFIFLAVVSFQFRPLRESVAS